MTKCITVIPSEYLALFKVDEIPMEWRWLVIALCSAAVGFCLGKMFTSK